MDAVLEWISQYGAAGLFGLLVLGIVGLPVPDETLLVFSGSLIAQGRLHPVFTYASGLGGSICGMTISYYIGLKVGHSAIERYGRFVHLTQDRVDLVNRWFHRLGHWLLTFGYFVPGVRHFTALVAGMSGLEFRVFSSYAYPGAAIWVGLFMGLGYLVGNRWREAVGLAHRYLLVLAIFAGVAAIVFWWRRRGRSMTQNANRRW